MHAYTALRVVAGAGGARRSAGLEAPFVGRESELELIVRASDASSSERRARLVSVTGEAGTGKSRLGWEFFKHVDGLKEERYWHQGRCLAYGEGVAYWALVEMIRGRAGILEEEEPAAAHEKLVTTVERFVPDERERRLVQPRLAHLLGLERRTATDPADLFSGWRLFFERMADTDPVILVFEDLQWADSGLLDFIDYLDAVAAQPDAPDVPDIRALARQTLTTAGHRAASLALGAEARQYFEQAAELADAPEERAELLHEAGRAAGRAADGDGARRLLGEAIELLEQCGRPRDAALVGALLADVLIAANRLDEAAPLLDRAQAALGGGDDDHEAVAGVAARRARLSWLRGDAGKALLHAERALEIADADRLVPILADALLTKSAAYNYSSRPTESGALIAAALQLALDNDLVDQALRAYFNHADLSLGLGRLEECEKMLESGLALARERGNRAWERALISQSVFVVTLRGQWDEALGRAHSLIQDEPDAAERQARSFLPVILAARGDTESLEKELERELPRGQWHEVEQIELLNRGIALRALGRLDEALASLLDTAREFVIASASEAPVWMGEAIDAALAAGRLEYVDDLLAAMAATSYQPLSAAQRSRGRAKLLALRGESRGAEEEFERAGTLLRDLGTPFWLAQVLLEHGELLYGLGRHDDAEPLLEEARETFVKLDAAPWLERTELASAPESLQARP